MAQSVACVGLLSPATLQAEAAQLLHGSQGQCRRVIAKIEDALESPESFRLFGTYDHATFVGAVCVDVKDVYASAAGVVSTDAARAVLAALRTEFGLRCTSFGGCDGPPDAVEALSKACVEMGQTVYLRDPVETMVLDTEPHKASGSAGTLKCVASRDKLLPTLAHWFEQFEIDVGNQAFSLNGHAQVLADLSSAAARGDLFVWEVKEKPVVMILLGRLLPKQVLCVYTVPHQRGKGHGQAAVAAVCAAHWKATGGGQPLFLSAVNKHGANRVYERVGFRSTGWLHGASFEAAVVSAVNDFSTPDAYSSLPTTDETVALHASTGGIPYFSCDFDAPFVDFSVPLVCH